MLCHSVWVPDMSKDMVPSFSRIEQFLDCRTMTINIQNAGSLSPLTQHLLTRRCDFSAALMWEPQIFLTLLTVLLHLKC